MRGAPALAIFILVLSYTADGLRIADDLDFNLELIKHQPCSYRKEKASWERKLEFEGGNDKNGPKLKAREGEGANCYSIGGKVHVFKEFKGDFSIYLEIKSTANKRQVPESCKDQKADGCGGFGSCLYCNACETFGRNVGVKAELLLNGKQIKCGEGLSPGVYDNLELLFCLPSINDILLSQGLSVETLKTLIQSEDGQSLRSMGIFATVYVFDTDVSEKMRTQARIERVYRRAKPSLFQDEPLPPEVYWSLPFNEMIREQREFVACHKLYGNVKITSTVVSGKTVMKSSLPLLLLGLLGVAVNADISVRIERHFPCSPSSGPHKENLLIKFPSYKSTGVNFKEEKNADGHKCFRMSGGTVEVFPPGLSGDKKYYVHLETRIGIHGKPERCVNADAEGCGGIGSCVHCDICRTMGGALRNFVQIYQKDAPAKCSAEGLPNGSYNDLSLKVCLPTKNELLPFLDQNSNRAEQLWDLFISSRARSGEIPLVIAARIFDRPVNKLNIKELNDALHGSKQGMIGCHWIYATVAQS